MGELRKQIIGVNDLEDCIDKFNSIIAGEIDDSMVNVVLIHDLQTPEMIDEINHTETERYKLRYELIHNGLIYVTNASKIVEITYDKGFVGEPTIALLDPKPGWNVKGIPTSKVDFHLKTKEIHP